MQSNTTDNRIAPHLCDNDTCTGCGACANICPVDAIRMTPHPVEGFYRPAVDGSKCIGCLKCERTCPVLAHIDAAESEQKVFAAWHKDPEVRAESSSGGAFSALAQTILDDGGCVVGAAYDNNLHLSLTLIDDADGLGALRASKYVQCDVGLIYRDIHKSLVNGRKVLFCGTPCQVAAVKAIFGDKFSGQLFTVDFICHGVPSPLFFKKYIGLLEKKYGKISNISFRNKDKGWYDATRVITLDSTNRRIRLKGADDCYWIAYNNHDNNLQNICHDCPFTGLKRNSDITLSDFWGIGKSTPFGHKSEIEKGVSMIMCNNHNGLRLLNESSSRLFCSQRSATEVAKGNMHLLKSSRRPSSRNTFYTDLGSMPFQKFHDIYLIPSFKTKLVKIMREYMPRPIIEFIRTRNQK